MRQTKSVLLLALFSVMYLYPIPPIDIRENLSVGPFKVSEPNFLHEAETHYKEGKFLLAIDAYQESLKNNLSIEHKVSAFKKLALSYAALELPEQSAHFLEKSLLLKLNTAILVDSGFDPIRESTVFSALEKKYTPKLTIWSFLYLYVALIGFYIAVIIHFKKKIDPTAKIFISGFIFIHSFFILHICLNITNYQYEFPHSYLMSTAFSFLYGPLLYLYFKRITQQYTLKKRDLLHLIPTVLLLLHLVPIYAQSADDKLALMLNRVAGGMNPGDSTYLTLLVALKFVSLVVYGFFVHKLYLQAKDNKELSKTNKKWQRNIFAIHVTYIATYGVYGVLIMNHIASGLMYHLPIVAMSIMVVYLGFSASVQPSVFSGLYSFENQLFFKYEKSGLTHSLSAELKENLQRLFDIEKIYKQNDISLESIANHLETTRHNASQVINEHFGMNFHELINKYRIQEAKHLLDSDFHKNLNIIDIAYEVGFNNKVTFNKAFKKDTQQTPSQYQRTKVAMKVKYT